MQSIVNIVEANIRKRGEVESMVASMGLPSQSFDSGLSFLSRADRQKPGCLIASASLPDIDIVDLLTILWQERSHLPMLVLMGKPAVSKVVECMKHGASSVLQHPLSLTDLRDAVRQALSEGEERMRHRELRMDIESRLRLLSTAERQVMRLIVAGLANRDVAEELGLGLRTVEAHRHRVMKKMRAETLPELVALACDAKLAGFQIDEDGALLVWHPSQKTRGPMLTAERHLIG